jgi:hypothetical protein
LYLKEHDLIIARSLFRIHLPINQALDLLISFLINNIVVLRFKQNEFFFNNRNTPNLFFIILIEFKIKINKETSFCFQIFFLVVNIIKFANFVG